MRIFAKLFVMITILAGAAFSQCGPAGQVVPNPFGAIPSRLCTGATPTGAATNGGVYWTGSGFASTATGGAGTLCYTSTNGGVPVWGACSGSAATAWSALSNPAGNTSLSMAANLTTLTWNATTGAAANFFTITDTLNNTGTGVALIVNLASGSAALPAQFSVNGNGVQVSNAGVLAKLGTGHVNADQANGTAISGTNGNVTSFGAANILADSAVAVANLATAASNFTSGNVIQAAGNNKTLSDSGVAVSALTTLTGVQTLTNKTLTTPKITTINDANGNPFLTSSATAAAVDSVTITNAATANPAVVAITGSGSDANISLNLVSKGAGVLQCNGNTCVSAAAALTSNLPVIGGGLGAVAVGTVSGNTTLFVTSTGTQTSTAVVKIDASGNHIASGCTIDASNNLSCPGSVSGGAASGKTGYVSIQGATSGSQGFTVSDIAGTATLYVIPTAVSLGSFLKDNGSTTCPTLPVGAPAACEQLAWASPAGSGTVNSGTIHQMAVYAATGTAVSGDANFTENAGAFTFGVDASVQGSMLVSGSGGGHTTEAWPSSGGGTWTHQSGTDTYVGRATTDTLTNKTLNCANNTCTVRAADISTANPLPTTTVAATRTISNALGEFIFCTTTCTVTPPATPIASWQFCVQNDDNVATVITIAATVGVQYETTARTSYKTANTAIASAGAVKDQICYVAKDATHWNVFSSTGTWN